MLLLMANLLAADISVISTLEIKRKVSRNVQFHKPPTASSKITTGAALSVLFDDKKVLSLARAIGGCGRALG
jgi:hypothetical protein